MIYGIETRMAEARVRALRDALGLARANLEEANAGAPRISDLAARARWYADHVEPALAAIRDATGQLETLMAEKPKTSLRYCEA